MRRSSASGVIARSGIALIYQKLRKWMGDSKWHPARLKGAWYGTRLTGFTDVAAENSYTLRSAGQPANICVDWPGLLSNVRALRGESSKPRYETKKASESTSEASTRERQSRNVGQSRADGRRANQGGSTQN